MKTYNPYEPAPQDNSAELVQHAANKELPPNQWDIGCCSGLLIFLFLGSCFGAWILYLILGAVFNDGYWGMRYLPDIVANRYFGAALILLILAVVLSIHVLVTKSFTLLLRWKKKSGPRSRD